MIVEFRRWKNSGLQLVDLTWTAEVTVGGVNCPFKTPTEVPNLDCQILIEARDSNDTLIYIGTREETLKGGGIALMAEKVNDEYEGAAFINQGINVY